MRNIIFINHTTPDDEQFYQKMIATNKHIEKLNIWSVDPPTHTLW